MRAFKLDETNYGHIKTHPTPEVAVLPLGATEPHNLHLPYGTDTFQVDEIGRRACEEATRRGAKVILLPTIPYGTETNMREFPFAMNLNPSTLFAVIRDLVDSLVKTGVHKVLLLNGHGGNEMKPLLREMYGDSPAHVFLCNWFGAATADQYDEIFDHPEDHAGEMETSLGLAFFPDLVATNDDGRLTADEGNRRELGMEALRKGWVSLTRPWHLLTTNSGSGNPHAATAEKGQRLMTLLVDRLAGFLCELSDAEVDDTFPFVGQDKQSPD